MDITEKYYGNHSQCCHRKHCINAEVEAYFGEKRQVVGEPMYNYRWNANAIYKSFCISLGDYLRPCAKQVEDYRKRTRKYRIHYHKLDVSYRN